MPKSVALLTVHGMGEIPRDYADPLLTRLQRRLRGRWDRVSVHSVYYKDLLQPNESRVWSLAAQGGTVRWDMLRRFLLFGFADAAGLENGKEQPFSVYAQTQIEIAKRLHDAHAAIGNGGPVVVISQSLGCQVFSSYLYDAQRQAPGRTPGIWGDIGTYGPHIAGTPLSEDELRFIAGGTVRRWLTTGCNIPIFVAAHKTMTIKPIARPTPDFQWLNIHDPDDVLGWPLGPLRDGYETLVEDRAINAAPNLFAWLFKSWNPWSHTAYWTDRDVLEPLQQMIEACLADAPADPAGWA